MLGLGWCIVLPGWRLFLCVRVVLRHSVGEPVVRFGMLLPRLGSVSWCPQLVGPPFSWCNWDFTSFLLGRGCEI